MFRRLCGRLGMWYRPWWSIPMIIGVFLVFEGPYLWLVYWKQAPAVDGRELLRMRDTETFVAMYLYGAYRFASFHPLYWVNYGRWLARTPWRFPKPLPLGPVHLDFRDVFVIGAAMLALHDPFYSVAYVPILFLLGYLLTLTTSLRITGTLDYAYLVAFGLGFVALFWHTPWLALGVAAAIYALGILGLRKSLRGFPWDKPYLLNERAETKPSMQNAILMSDQTTQSWLGWPHGVLQPKKPAGGISLTDGTLLSLLFGWWLYAAFANFPGPDGMMFLEAISTAVLVGGPMVRFYNYFKNHRAPISLWGRIFTLRWIVPSFDKAWVAPILALIVPTVFVGIQLRHQLLPFSQTVTLCTAIVCSLILVLNAGPTLEAWDATGANRIVPVFPRQTHDEL
jgi:hypothetical protein